MLDICNILQLIKMIYAHFVANWWCFYCKKSITSMCLELGSTPHHLGCCT